MTENEISYQIRGAIFKVYNNLGPGLLESIYVIALIYELEKMSLAVSHQTVIPAIYEDITLKHAYKADIIVENKVIIEVKSVAEIAAVHHMQTLTYLKLSKLKLGILVNFNTSNISKSILRKVNNL